MKHEQFDLNSELSKIPEDIFITVKHGCHTLSGEGWNVVIGDSFEYMSALYRAHETLCFDHVITDPPYTEATHKGARSGKDGVSDQGIDFDAFSDYDLMQFVRFSQELCKRWILAFCEVEMLGRYRDFAVTVKNRHNKRKTKQGCWIRSGLWVKTDPAPQFTGDRPGMWGEGIAIMHSMFQAPKWNEGGSAGIWKTRTEKGKDRFHPTQKPLSLMTALVGCFANQGEHIFDPFMGSGSTGVAALRKGCRFTGVEQNPKMAIEAALRLYAETQGLTHHDYKAGQTSMFGAFS